MSFSNSGGGTLALPSPTHAHNIDVTSSLRTLRRSLSRSPSKFNLSRTNSLSSHSSQGSRPASPQSPCRRYRSTPLHQIQQLPLISQTQSAPAASGINQNTQDSPVFTPLRPSIRLSLRSAKAKTGSPSRPLARARASPKSPITKSPLRRALNTTSDSVNTAQRAFITSMSTPQPAAGQENYRLSPLSPLCDSSENKPSRHSLHLDVSGSSQNAFMKALDAKESPSASATGSLKRSDATMNLDQQSQGSPMAKRRSLHGITETMNIFAPPTNTLNFDIHEDMAVQSELTSEGVLLAQREPLPSPTPSHLHKRTSSLRKSTLQQRYGDKSSLGLGRRTGERQLANMSGSDLFTPSKNRPRISTDHFCPPPVPRDSPFSCGTPLPNPSIHPMDKNTHQPHPLSKTLTTSSSGNSLTEEQSTFYAPAPKPHPFTQSLPLNAMRPTARSTNDHTKAVTSTPNQHGQLWLGAFNSTGLISKVNRNLVDDEQKMAPPDTPCKKHTNQFATFPPPSGSAKKKMRNYSNRGSFAGISSTLFNPTPDTFGNEPRGMRDIFGRNPATRKTSFKLFQEVDDSHPFGDDSGNSNPATPTKNSTMTPSLSNLSEQSSEQSLESPSANRTVFMPPTSAVRPPLSRQSTCKFAPETLGISMDVDDDAQTLASRNAPTEPEESPTLHLSFSSFGRSRAQRGLKPPSLLGVGQGQSTPLTLKTSKNALAKLCRDSASPISGRRTPQTPQARLSSLALGVKPLSLSIPPADGNLGDINMRAPVTPTSRGGDFRSSTSSIFVTPVNARNTSVDVDPSLTSRFVKADQIGKGEFSTVYRCEKGDDHQSSTPRQPLTSPQKKAVYAVKKSRHQFTGHKDRQSKVREVEILSQLTHCDHVVMYVDHWEYQDRLYIQTEFCEEGTLEKFFGTIGNGGRLDDFRIYKILQDLCLGLKEIHAAGFMHLDIKPANILINFEGSLKIADFGLAQPINRKKGDGNDVEGDREYMAPEVLKGHAGPSSDVFSLGLMILEAAANVVLPPNGPSWQMLRSGDLSEVPSLTWTPSSGFHQDATSLSYDVGTLSGSHKRSELYEAPMFMTNAEHECSLDSIVRRMTAENEIDRPLPENVLELEGLRWVGERRTAPATVFEGHWGPAQIISTLVQNPFEVVDAKAMENFSPFSIPHFVPVDDEDTVMTDV